MKKIYFLLLVTLCVQWSQAQTVNIPNPTLRYILLNFDCVDTNGDGNINGNVDVNDDGLIQLSEAQAVTTLRISNPNGVLTNASINSIEGLESFSNITDLTFFILDELSGDITNTYLPASLEVLTIQGINSFTGNIDLSGNTTIKEFSMEIITNSGTANFSNCSNLENINISQGIDNLTVFNCPSLTFFRASNNQITSFDIIDCPNVSTFEMTNTLIETLDLSGIGINNGDAYTNIYLGDNPNMKYLNIKNGSNDFVSMETSPPLEYLCVDEGFELEIYSMQHTTTNVNTYCSFVPGGEYVTVEGTATLDALSNGCDVNDPVFPNLEYEITDGSITSIITTDTSGDYGVYVRGGTHTITPQLENPTYFTVTPASITVDTSTATNSTVQNFCVTPAGTHNDVTITMIPLEQARPGFDTSYTLVYENKGTTTLSGSIELTFDDAIMDLVSTNPMTTSQAVNTLSWNYTNLAPLESQSIAVTMNINSPIESPAVNGGDILSFEAMITPVVADETPTDNVMTLQQTVVNSFDPNDIRCLEGERVTTDYIGEYVHYLIRFENTGTASAVNVVVANEIDATKFDIATLHPEMSSHPMVTNIKDHKVEFIFENINLPFDDATNDGYVVFKIKTLPSLVENDTFTSVADIFFDFNAPITTNTASTLISNPLSVSEENLNTETIALYPNPTTGILYVTAQEPIENIEIRTIEGRLIKHAMISTNSNTYEINLSDVASGIYLVNTTTRSRKTIKKIVKQ